MARTPEKSFERMTRIAQMSVSEMDDMLDQSERDAALRRGVERLRDEYRSIGWLNNTGARLVGADVVAQLDALLRAGEET